MTALHDDALRLVAGHDLTVSLLMGQVCTVWRAAIEGGVGDTFEARAKLARLAATACTDEVCDALALTRRTVRLYPHHDRIYQRNTVLRIYRAHGGSQGLMGRRRRRAR